MTQTLNFSIGSFATGSLTIDDNDYVTSISGVINGQQITGLVNFGGADNNLVFSGQQINGIPNKFYYYTYYYDVDQSGLSFSAGGIDYLVSGTPGSIGEPVVVSNSSGASTQSATFYADYNGPQMPIALCFATSTRIRTARGECAVDTLVAGDMVVTAAGATRPIVWVGHRDLDGGGKALPQDQQPVRIAAHAFGVDLPARDLYLSPGHPVLVGNAADGAGGHLVPIMCLINGTTIERARVDAITYWHVELDTHDILLAEGLPAESYIDCGTRSWFDGDAEAHALADPDFVVPGLGARCRPVAIGGAPVEAERRRLDALFTSRLAAPCAWPAADSAFV